MEAWTPAPQLQLHKQFLKVRFQYFRRSISNSELQQRVLIVAFH